MKKIIQILALITVVIFFESCSNSNNDDIVIVEEEDIRILLKTFNIEISAQYSIPANVDRIETGTVLLELYDDDTLDYTIIVNDLSSTDELLFAHVHTGDLVSNGHFAIGLINNIDNFFDGNTASGTFDLSQGQIDILNGPDIYFNLHSAEKQAGLLRGSLDKTIDFSMDIILSTSNTVPPVMGRIETGIVYLRMDSESKLLYKILIDDLDKLDQITAAHIHFGETGTTGSVFITLAVSDLDIGITKILEFTSGDKTIFLNDNLYINVHSLLESNGLLRGQIR